jgi:hypothetical protein
LKQNSEKLKRDREKRPTASNSAWKSMSDTLNTFRMLGDIGSYYDLNTDDWRTYINDQQIDDIGWILMMITDQNG